MSLGKLISDSQSLCQRCLLIMYNPYEYKTALNGAVQQPSSFVQGYCQAPHASS